MTKKENIQPLPQIFWNRFEGEKEKLFRLVFSRQAYAAYQRIGELLSEANYPHVYEVTSDEDHAHLIFTPESNWEVAAIVNEFVSMAPPIQGWRIFNRRQRQPVEDALAMLEHVYGVDASDTVLSFEVAPNGFDVAMHTKLAEILGEPEKEGFVSFFLEHALGEEFTMNCINKRGVAHIDESKESLPPSVFVEKILAASK